MVEYIKEQDSLNTGRKTINEELTRSNNNANKAKIDSAEALLKAIASMDLSESVRNQLNQIVIEGDSSVEAAAARVDEKNVTHDTLKERIDDGFLGVTSQLNDRPTHEEVKLQLGRLADATPEFVEDISEMGDISKLYVNLSDGYLYSYTNAEWTNTGVKYQSTGLSDKSVTPRNIDVNYNSISSLSFVEGSISNTTGGNNSNAGRIRSVGFLKVEKGFKVNLLNTDFSFAPFLYKSPNIEDFVEGGDMWYKEYKFDKSAYVRLVVKLDNDSDEILNYTESVETIMKIPEADAFITKKGMIKNKIIDKEHLTESLDQKIEVVYESSEVIGAINEQVFPKPKVYPKIKDLETYETSFTGAKNRIFILNYPLESSGQVSFVFKSNKNNQFTVALLERTGNGNEFKVLDKSIAEVKIGINKVDTPFYSEGDGSQYIGLVGIIDELNTPSGFTTTINQAGNYLNFLSFTEDTTIFNATPQTTGSDIAAYVMTQHKLDKSVPESINDLKKDIQGETSDVDLIMFMGQSNMAGRGVASQAPVVPRGKGYEFRAISDPTKLYSITEPFGKNENKDGGISESTKTGSLVSSFVIEYSELTRRTVIGVSASKGGSSINQWQPDTPFLNDAIERYNNAKNWLVNNGYVLKNQIMLWCQGETDGDRGMSKSEYMSKFKLMVDEMVNQGIEKCYVIRIGNHRDDPEKYDVIIEAQTEICKMYENAVLVSTKFDRMASDGLMKDQFHYTQEGYNITGADAGINTAFHINNKKEPYMLDWENENIYFSDK